MSEQNQVEHQPQQTRRERKKAETRQKIADAALQLFLKRGYDGVTVKDVADAADVALATVYAYFPQKEALLFDEDEEMRLALISSVTNRPDGMSISRALHEFFLGIAARSKDYDKYLAQFQNLVRSTPELQEYERQMWRGHASSLAETISSELGLPTSDATVQTFSRLVMESWALLDTSQGVEATLTAVFGLLEPGWNEFEKRAVSSHK